MTQPTSYPKIVDDNITAVLKREEQKLAKESFLHKAARKIADAAGTVTFVIVHAILFTAWIGINLTPMAFDPYPFTFLTMCVSLESIFLSSFLLIAQNVADEKSESRHALDLQINMLAERETTEIVKLLNMVAKKVGISDEDRQAATELEEPTTPEEILDKLEEKE